MRHFTVAHRVLKIWGIPYKIQFKGAVQSLWDKQMTIGILGSLEGKAGTLSASFISLKGTAE